MNRTDPSEWRGTSVSRETTPPRFLAAQRLSAIVMPVGSLNRSTQLRMWFSRIPRDPRFQDSRPSNAAEPWLGCSGFALIRWLSHPDKCGRWSEQCCRYQVCSLKQFLKNLRAKKKDEPRGGRPSRRPEHSNHLTERFSMQARLESATLKSQLGVQRAIAPP